MFIGIEHLRGTWTQWTGWNEITGWNLFQSLSLLTSLYAASCALFAVVAGPIWIYERPQFQWAHHRWGLRESSVVRQTHRTVPDVLRGRMFARMVRLPHNQITSLERNVKRLTIEGLPKGLQGFRIAHLSDIHLTGQLGVGFYRCAIDWLISQQPDLVIVSGDLVDYEHAVDMIAPVFAGLMGRQGAMFILGNHDKRLAHPAPIVSELEALGWIDLGKADHRIECQGAAIELVGNEAPWFYRHSRALEGLPSTKPAHARDEKNTEACEVLRLGVAHSPDQLRWGAQRKCQLMLCGHTHGGQIRLPLIGPLISPSWYGSKYASGVFAHHRMLMHVSRGMSGTHPFRWGCLPEVSVLELATT